MKLSVADCRRILREVAGSLTDEEVERISNALDSFADVLIESFIEANFPSNGDEE